jgi:hypothetical protein
MSRHVTAMSRHVTAMSRHVTAMSRHVTAMSRHVTACENLLRYCNVTSRLHDSNVVCQTQIERSGSYGSLNLRTMGGTYSKKGKSSFFNEN